MNTEELRIHLASGALAEAQDTILRLAAPCVRLRTERTDLESLPLGASRIGGWPDVPAGFEWPQWKGERQSFVAQFKLDEVPGIPGLGLPSHGSLLFFYTAHQDTWGFDPKDHGSFGIFYVPPAQELRRPSDIPHVPDGGSFHCCSVEFHKAVSVPPWESRPIEQLRLKDEQADAYFNLLDTNWGGQVHQIGGFPDQVQGDMTFELQLVTNGLYTGNAKAWNDPRAARLKEGRDSWRLLFQVASDANAEMMWGDAGYVYFWMKDSDLSDRSFEKAWMILQCG
jgi:uncharacterized protein YwqG